MLVAVTECKGSEGLHTDNEMLQPGSDQWSTNHKDTEKCVQKAEGWKYKPQDLQCGKTRAYFWKAEGSCFTNQQPPGKTDLKYTGGYMKCVLKLSGVSASATHGL